MAIIGADNCGALFANRIGDRVRASNQFRILAAAIEANLAQRLQQSARKTKLNGNTKFENK
jgi:hypothetical protein